MIRGILPTSRGYNCNGMIVTATAMIPETVAGKQAWYIEPVIHFKDELFLGALAETLFPLDNPHDDEVDTHSTIKETI